MAEERRDKTKDSNTTTTVPSSTYYGHRLMTNVHVSNHPVIVSKISELRSKTTDARAVRQLTSEIAAFLAYESTASELSLTASPETSTTPIGEDYNLLQLSPARLCLVPILRSGLGMADAFLAYLPPTTEVHHLGLFREEETLNAVEYYNKLPRITDDSQREGGKGVIDIAYIIDPIIATGNTACAAIQILREWRVKKIVFVCVLASSAGLARVAKEWSDGCVVYVGAVDDKLNERGYIVPGLGDIGDRLYQTKY